MLQLLLLNISSNKLNSLPESIGSCFSLEELQADGIFYSFSFLPSFLLALHALLQPHCFSALGIVLCLFLQCFAFSTCFLVEVYTCCFRDAASIMHEAVKSFKWWNIYSYITIPCCWIPMMPSVTNFGSSTCLVSNLMYFKYYESLCQCFNSLLHIFGYICR